MGKDIRTVVWKELMQIRRNARSYLTQYGMLAVAFGIFFPMGSVDNIYQGKTTSQILYFAFLTIVIASSLTVSSFLGEKLQKTLNTLLTTRLSDLAIYFGKSAAIMLFSYTVLIVIFLFNIGSVFFIGRARGYVGFPYSTIQVAHMIILPGFILFYVSGLGVLLSLKTDSFRGSHLLNMFINIPVLAAVYFAVLRSGLSWSNFLWLIAVFAFIGSSICYLGTKRFNRQLLLLK